MANPWLWLVAVLAVLAAGSYADQSQLNVRGTLLAKCDRSAVHDPRYRDDGLQKADHVFPPKLWGESGASGAICDYYCAECLETYPTTGYMRPVKDLQNKCTAVNEDMG
eukprot:1329101-Amorphochlora_amoeboformis.AAC.2